LTSGSTTSLYITKSLSIKWKRRD